MTTYQIIINSIPFALSLIANAFFTVIYIRQKEVIATLAQANKRLEFEVENSTTINTLTQLQTRLAHLESEAQEHNQRTVSPFFYQNLQAPVDHLGTRPGNPTKGVNNLTTEALAALPRCRDQEKLHPILNNFFSKAFPNDLLTANPLQQCEQLKDFILDENSNQAIISSFVRHYKSTISLSGLQSTSQLQQFLNRMVKNPQYYPLLEDFYQDLFPTEESLEHPIDQQEGKSDRRNDCKLLEHPIDQQNRIVGLIVEGGLTEEKIQEMILKFKTLTSELMDRKVKSLD